MLTVATQKALLSGMGGTNKVAMENAIQKNCFYAVAIDTLCDGLTLPLTVVDGSTLPVVFATLEQATADLDEDIKLIQEDIDAGERDPDDSFDGEVIMVRWESDSELTLLSSDGEHVLKRDTISNLCGGA